MTAMWNSSDDYLAQLELWEDIDPAADMSVAERDQLVSHFREMRGLAVTLLSVANAMHARDRGPADEEEQAILNQSDPAAAQAVVDRIDALIRRFGET